MTENQGWSDPTGAGGSGFTPGTGAATGTRGWAPLPPGTPPTKFCFACAASIDSRAEVCPSCGVRQPYLPGVTPGGGGVGVNDALTVTGKSKIVASLLAIFLGIFGVHKFYLGDTKMGVLYAAFFWTAIPAIVGFVEGLIWLFQPNEVWLAKYGSR